MKKQATNTRINHVLAVLLSAGIAAGAQAADLLDTVKSRGTLKIAVEGTYPPFNFKDQKTNELTGFDVDVAKLLAAKLGVKPEFVTTEWSGILAGLSAGKYDVIVNQVGITEQRQQAFDFSNPYTLSSPQLIVRKNEQRDFKSLDDLKGKKLGLGQGTNYEQKAKAVAGIDVKTYPGAPEYLHDLADGRFRCRVERQLDGCLSPQDFQPAVEAQRVFGRCRKNGHSIPQRQSGIQIRYQQGIGRSDRR